MECNVYGVIAIVVPSVSTHEDVGYHLCLMDFIIVVCSEVYHEA